MNLEKIPLVGNLVKTVYRWSGDDGNLLAAAVAYYAALAFFPLMLVLISGLGFVLRFTNWGRDAEAQLLNVIANYASPNVRDNVQMMLDQVQENASIGGPLGLIALLFTAATLFAHFERAFDRIWNVENPDTQGFIGAIRNLVLHRLRAFLMLLCLGFLMLIVFLSGIALKAANEFADRYMPLSSWIWWMIQIGVSVSLNCLVLTLLYRVLPKMTVRWREAARGGLLAAVVWEMGRLALLGLVVGKKYSAYGVVGSFIILMLWIYYASAVIFLGAEYVQIICEQCHPERVKESKAAAD